MRVCYFGTFDPAYVRNRTLIDGLERAGAEVRLCQAPLWQGTDSRIATASRSMPRTLWRLAVAQLRLLRRYAAVPPHEALVVGYPGHADVPTAWLCARTHRRVLVFDAFLSLYETAIEDRQLAGTGGAFAAAMRAGDRLSATASDLVVLDTEQHVAYFQERVSARPRYAVVPVSAEDIYMSVPPAGVSSGPLKVIYFGAYIPLHGIDVVLEAAHLLRDRSIEFAFIGRGQMLAAAQAAARERALANVTFDTGWYAPEQLCERIAQADVCLGVFAAGSKAARVVPNKVVAALASGRPVVTAGTPAAASLLHDGSDALLCAPGDATALAECLKRLQSDRQLGARIGAAGRELFRANLSVDAVGRRFLSVLHEVAA